MKMNYIEANFVAQRLLVHSSGDLMIISDMFSEVINIFPLRKLKIETNESIVDIQ